MGATPTTQARYVVVLRARSAARLLPEDGWEHYISAVPGLGLGEVRVRTYTRWVRDGQHSLPRELVVDVRGNASSLEEAIVKFSTIARLFVTFAGFVANVDVGSPDVHIAYDDTPNSSSRPFLETFIPDEIGLVGEGRILRKDLLVSACMAFLDAKHDSARISRALRQYELALRHWYLGGEWLALSHLYMAVEALTKAVIRKESRDRGISEEELAESLGVITNDPDRPRWVPALGEQVRAQLIFAGDRDTFKAAKDASDGLEHGYLELDEVAANALRCADKTFEYVRRTIIDLLDLQSEVARDLMAIKPMDVQSRRKVVRGRLTGDAADPAAEDQLYPLLEWRSGIGSIEREGSTFKLQETERITVRTHPDIKFELERVETLGRITDGQAPVEVSQPPVVSKEDPEPESVALLRAIGPMVDEAAAGGAQTGHNYATVLAFNLFGQGVAFFESAYALIRDQRPVEALAPLRGLVIVAARFEQMDEIDGPGTGIAARMALNAADELGASPEAASAHRLKVAELAKNAGIIIPADLKDPQESAIYHSLKGEMRLAESVINATYAPIGFHIDWSVPETAGFHTQVKRGPFTEMVGSACVIAQADLVMRAAKLFNWKLDQQSVEALLAEARTLNEAAAVASFV